MGEAKRRRENGQPPRSPEPKPVDALPPPETRAVIAEAIHQAVQHVTGTDGNRHCVLYATAGAILARLVTGHGYARQIGVVQVLTGDVDTEGHELCVTLDPKYDDREFHAWCVRQPPSWARRGQDEYSLPLERRRLPTSRSVIFRPTRPTAACSGSARPCLRSSGARSQSLRRWACPSGLIAG